MAFTFFRGPVLLLLSCATVAAAPAGDNLYWPGHFDTHLYGGIFSNQINVTLTPDHNRTPGGKGSWRLNGNAYQHLELLVPGHQKYVLSFYAKAQQPLTLELKVISPGEKDAEGKIKPKETVLPIAIEPSPDWKRCEVEFVTTEPYPGPVQTEVLLTCFNPGPAAYVDDVSIVAVGEPAKPRAGRATEAVRSGGFETVDGWNVLPGEAPLGEVSVVPLRHGKGVLVSAKPEAGKDAAVPGVWQMLDADSLRGKKIRISAEVTYVTLDEPLEPWGGVLFVLDGGAEESVITGNPNPLWLPVGQSAKPGEPKRVASEFQVPAGVESLRLRIQTQPAMAANRAVVGGVRIEVLE